MINCWGLWMALALPTFMLVSRQQGPAKYMVSSNEYPVIFMSYAVAAAAASMFTALRCSTVSGPSLLIANSTVCCCCCYCLQGSLPSGVDQRYLSGFLAREIDRAAAKSLKRSSSSSSSRVVSGAALLECVVRQYGQLMGAGHLALAAHKLAELQQGGLAGSEQVGGDSWNVSTLISRLSLFCFVFGHPRVVRRVLASVDPKQFL